jgi:hypothetical protein
VKCHPTIAVLREIEKIGVRPRVRLTGNKKGAYPRTPYAVFGYFWGFWGSGGVNWGQIGLGSQKNANLSDNKIPPKFFFWLTQIFRVLDFLNMDPGGSGWVWGPKK